MAQNKTQRMFYYSHMNNFHTPKKLVAFEFPSDWMETLKTATRNISVLAAEHSRWCPVFCKAAVAGID